jgi:hypothetical protein
MHHHRNESRKLRDFMGKLEGKIALATGDDSSYVTGTELFVDGGFAQV